MFEILMILNKLPLHYLLLDIQSVLFVQQTIFTIVQSNEYEGISYRDPSICPSIHPSTRQQQHQSVANPIEQPWLAFFYKQSIQQKWQPFFKMATFYQKCH
ncbi:unnamed protein product [Owenia fusiformis]|uniref:Uncharacterized protein n=1 Tax=Owenia fusiformis TaxID=6347 RepID=A0A8S4N2B4_OWEFU|nr:unnamed protein product [Owenia fusiformis]